MSDLTERVRALGEKLDAGYDAARTEAALGGLHAKRRRRRVRRALAGSVAGALCMAVGVAWLVASRPPTSAQAPTGPKPLFTLTDGSVVKPLDPSSRVVARTVSPTLVELELVAGSAHFDVAPDRERQFRVAAGRVGIAVIGTRFSVERQGERTVVAVEAGRVRVEWERGQQLLDPGERGVFPPFETAAEPSPATGEQAEASVPTVAPALDPPRPAADWRTVARRGDFPAAYRLLREKAKPPIDIAELLLAADVARGAGHVQVSARYLERALATHPNDPQAAVVAFTLGRIRLTDLGDGVGAAAAFARARAAAPGGPLAEDALAREIEARARGGDQATARELADEYVRRWPSGRRLREVRHFGGRQ
jgi:transmembrane sensor